MTSAAQNLKSSYASLIADKVSAWTGNRFLDKHLSMIESRLTRRFLQLELKSIEEYYDYLSNNEDEEKEHLISLLTTHHTYFFRESSHFDFIRDQIIPQIIKEVQSRADKTIQILSMACSKGHEAYSLSTYLDYHLKKDHPGIDFKITATDVDAHSVEYANNGVYPFEELKRIPMQYLDGYWVRGKGDIADFAKIKNEIRKKCEFYTDNLLEISTKTKAKKYDIILCRNVFIYFDQDKIIQITKSLSELLNPTGHMIVGISESLRGLSDKLAPVGPSVYKLVNKDIPVIKDTKVVEKPIIATPGIQLPNPIRVLCVDDSPTIHTVLGKILSENQGFKIVGKAMNGQEAVEFLKSNKADVITLDIHMPVMTGIEYLEKHFKTGHIPVVMMTSVTRENSDLAFKALNLGASDYVEKPTLHNLKEISQELITKVKSAVMHHMNQPKVKNFDQQFAKVLQIQKPETCLNVVIGTMGERDKIKELIKRSADKGIACVVTWEGAKSEEAQLITSLFKQWGMIASHVDDTTTTKVKFTLNQTELENYMKTVQGKMPKTITSVTAGAVASVLNKGIHFDSKVVLEEAASIEPTKVKRDWFVFPFTSMEYTIFEVFSK